METIRYTDMRRNLNAAMDKAAADRAPILITRRDGESVVMISAEEWAGMEEVLRAVSCPK
jgi:antitoxin YefM